MTKRRTFDDIPDRLARLDRLADALDSRFRVPLTQIRFGWDTVLGLLPGIGDIAALAPAGYILLEAHDLGAPTSLKARMAANIMVDTAIGSVPVVGDIFDIGWRANRRNVTLLRTHFGVEASVPLNGVPA